jgi:hypothetical protein
MRASWVRHACRGFALGLLLFPRPAAAQELDPRTDARLNQELNLEVRSAPIADVFQRLSGPIGVQLGAQAGIADQRVTIYGRRSTLHGLLRPMGALFRSPWVRVGSGSEMTYALSRPTEFEAQAVRAEGQRRTAFISRLLATADALNVGDPEAVAAQVRNDVAARAPYLTDDALDAVTADYLGQTLLALPLRRGLSVNLLRAGNVWTPLRRLPPVEQRMMLDFAAEYYQRNPPVIGGDETTTAEFGPSAPTPEVLESPNARVEYRLLYGDRWTGEVLLIRVGTGDSWATAILPSSLFGLPSPVALYPEADRQIAYPELNARVDYAIDTKILGFDQALTGIAKRSGINIIADSYPRPAPFREAVATPVLTGATLGQLLGQVAQYYGYIWWKESDYYVFRHRFFAEEARVDVADRFLLGLGMTLTPERRITAATLALLAALTEEQLMTLHLTAGALQSVLPPEQQFDFNEVHTARAALVLFQALPPQQRELVTGRGLPAIFLPANEQRTFANLAYDRGILLDPTQQYLWGFRVSGQLDPEPVGSPPARIGRIQFIFAFGQGAVRRTTLPIKIPVPPPAEETGPAPGTPAPATPPAVTPNRPMPASPSSSPAQPGRVVPRSGPPTVPPNPRTRPR